MTTSNLELSHSSDISHSQHTPFYCEENVYLFCKKLCANGIADSDGSDLFVAFISNEKKQVPAPSEDLLWFFRAGVEEVKSDVKWLWLCIVELRANQSMIVEVDSGFDLRFFDDHDRCCELGPGLAWPTTSEPQLCLVSWNPQPSHSSKHGSIEIHIAGSHLMINVY